MNNLKEKIEKVLIMNSGEYLEYSKGEIADELQELIKPQWIPCSERLPDQEEQHCLITLNWENNRWGTDKIWTTSGTFYKSWVKNGKWEYGKDGAYVIAWMELPKPYEIV